MIIPSSAKTAIYPIQILREPRPQNTQIYIKINRKINGNGNGRVVSTNHISRSDSQADERRSEPGTPLERVFPSISEASVDERNPVAVDGGGALQKGDWSERNVIGGAAVRSVHRLRRRRKREIGEEKKQ